MRTGYRNAAGLRAILLLGCLLLAAGCAGEVLRLDEDARIAALKSTPPLPYTVALAPARLGFDPEQVNRTLEKGLSMPPAMDAVTSEVLQALTTARVFRQVAALDAGARGKAPLDEAWERKLDFLLDLRFDKWDTVYRGTNGWFVPNLFLWFQFLVPSWIVPDQDYATDITCTVTLRSVHTGKVVYVERVRASCEKALNDIQRGFQFLGIFRAPGAFDREDWESISGKVTPAAVHEFKVGLASTLARETRARHEKGELPPLLRKRLALVVGVSNYQDHRLPKALFARRDAEALHAFLVSPRGGGMPARNAALLTGEKATVVRIRHEVEEFLAGRAKAQDTILLFFAGLGTLLAREEGAPPDRRLLPYDASPDTLDRTSLDVAALMDTLAATGARAVVVLGTSFKPDGSNRSLRFAGKAATAAPHPYGAPGKNLTLLAAARPHQECGFIEKQRHGTFMHFFLQGLQGKADQNSDGRVSLAEAYHFARKNTEIQAFVDESRAQNPVLVGQDLDDLWLEPDSAP